MNITKVYFFLFVLFGLSCQKVQAQIDHYWSWNFNTSSSLLAGAVVGGKPDASSIFYNPALIIKSGESQVAANASLFSIEFLKYTNAFGESLDINSIELQFQPRFLSYSWSGKTDINYEFAFFTKNTNEFDENFNYSNQVDILNKVSGQETYNGAIQLNNAYGETTLAVGASKRTSERLSLGITMFGTRKNFNYEYERSLAAFAQTDSILFDGIIVPAYVASYNNSELAKGWDIRISWKAGIHYQGSNWGFGAAITTPSIQLLSSAKANKDLSRVNIYDLNENPVLDSALTFSEENLNLSLKDPISISAGFEYKFSDIENRILFSIEHFRPIKSYDIVPIGSVRYNSIPQAPGEIVEATVFGGATPVTNFAIGYSKYINENVSILTGMRTDFSSSEDLVIEGRSFFEVPRIFYDITHFTLGGEFKFKQLEFVSGLQYSRGRSDDLPNLVNMANPLEYIGTTGVALQGQRENTMDVQYNALTIFFGFTYNILSGN